MQWKRLNRYRTGGTNSKMILGLPAPKTPEGRIYRFSPNPNAHPRHFLLGPVSAQVELTALLRARMKHEPRSPRSVCPYSGVVDADDAFAHPEDRDAVVAMAKHALVGDVQDHLAKIAKDFNRRQGRGGFIKMTMNVKAPKRSRPRFTRRDLMRELVCDHCGRDYGVFAIGLFCPDCGAPNLRLHFGREAELVADQVGIAEEIGEGADELAYRLLGNAHEDVLTAFEATLKTVYLYGKHQAGAESRPKVGNDFQNIDRATKRFAELGIDPFDGLSDPERKALALNIQKRHIIGHNLGVVDDKFAAHAADAKVGETVQLVADEIRLFASIGQKVIDNLDAWLGGSPSPTIGMTPPLEITGSNVSPDDPNNLMALDLELGLLARRIALWVAEQDVDGLRNFVKRDALREAFGEATAAELKEAVAELKTDGFIETSREISSDIPSFRPTQDLYLTFDGIAFQTNPMADIADVAERALTYERGVDVDGMFKAIGWTLRRFNPIVAYVADQVPDGRVIRTWGTGYSVKTFFLLDEDRVEMKRFIKRLRR